MHILNLGILAHVDAGKTSLTERLLHAAGVIAEPGSVDDGSTQTDSLELERRRGITIRSAVVSFAIEDVTVNLIDTPGHPDFIAEVERSLGVLDGAVLVISAVEGVQSQTRVLMRALQRLRLPTLMFVNKMDRSGADAERTLAGIRERLTPAIVPVEHVAGAAEVLAEHDDGLLTAYVNGGIPPARLRRALAAQTRRALVHPVFFGSAITGAGVDGLMRGIRELLPAAGGDAGGPPAGTVFKVERGPAGEKVAYVRMRSGTLRLRDRLPYGKVTAIDVFGAGAGERPEAVAAGQIGRVWGLGGVRIADPIGAAEAADRAHFAPPTLETVILPRRRADRGALHAALTQLAEQDPLIGLRQGDELSLTLYGEVQKEVIEATLAEEYGVEVTFRETTTICVERLDGTGAAVERMGEDGNPYLATVGLRLEPAPVGAGVSFGLEVELGSMPPAFFRTTEEAVNAALDQGLHGWPVPDCAVTMTHAGYAARQSHSHATFDKSMSTVAGDFRALVPLVLLSALREAGTTVCEPMHRFRLELPADTLGAVLAALARLRAVPSAAGEVLEGEIPAARVHELQRQLPGLTRGEGVLETAFDHYAPVRGEGPTRARSGPDPLDRDDYLRRVTR